MDKKLRILFLSQACLIKYGLKCGFDQLGHETAILDGDCYAIWLNPLEKHIDLIYTKVGSFKPDLIFTEGYANLPLHLIYPTFNKLGIPVMTWDIEADCTPTIGEYLSSCSDFIWTTMDEKIEGFRQKGINSDHLLFGCNSEFHKPVQSEDRFRHDISLVARNYSNRYKESEWFVMKLLEKKLYDIMIYGIWWDDYERPINLKNYPENHWKEPNYNELPYEWLPIVINSSKVMLGMNVPVISNSHCSMRPFETLASSENSLLVGHYQKAQYNYFKDHMYHVKNPEETEMAVKEILSMTDEQRKEKARLAREYVYEHHDYKLRAQQVVDKYFELFGG